jgi:hypothetical protein
LREAKTLALRKRAAAISESRSLCAKSGEELVERSFSKEWIRRVRTTPDGRFFMRACGHPCLGYHPRSIGSEDPFKRFGIEFYTALETGEKSTRPTGEMLSYNLQRRLAFGFDGLPLRLTSMTVWLGCQDFVKKGTN